MKDNKTKKEIIEEILREIKDDICQLDFGQVTIYIQNNCPYRKEVKKSKKYKIGG